MSYMDIKADDYPFPSRDISENEKSGEKYSLDYARAIYARYKANRCVIRYDSVDDFDMLRLYGKGSQPISIYKNYLLSDAKDGSPPIPTATGDVNRSAKSRKGWENIDWGIVSPIPRIKKIIKSYVDQFGYDIFVDTIDPISNELKDNMKWQTYTLSQNFEFLKEAHFQAGIPMDELEFFPASRTELDLFESMGGFKLNFAKAMQKLIRHTEEISGMDDDLQDDLVDDALDFGVLITKLEFDPTIGKFKYRKVNPKYYVGQFVEEGNYDRSEYAGELRFMTISELKQLMPGKPESYFKAMASDYRGKEGNGNVQDSDWDNFSKRMGGERYRYDSFNVAVLDVEWIDYECQQNLLYDSAHGRRTVVPMEYGTEPKQLSEKQKNFGAKQEVLKTNIRKVRYAMWVIGTDCLVKCGEVNMQDRPNNTDVMHDYRVVVLNDKPIVEQLVPIANDMELSYLDYQNSRAMAVKAGYSIDVGMMQNLEEGDNFKWMDLLEYWRKTGYLLHTQSLTGTYQGGAVRPIMPIESSMQAVINEAVQTWEFAIKRIEDITGLNIAMLGATANPNAPVGTTQLSANAAMHVLKPIIKGVGGIKRKLAATTMRRLQLALKVRDDIMEAYKPVVGEADVQILKMAEKDAVQYGMSFEPRASQQAKQDIIEAAKIALTNRREGRAGLKESEFFWIIEQVEGKGDLKELRATIDYLTAKSQRDLDEKQRQNIQLQGQQNMQLQQQMSQGQMQAENLRGQREMAVERMRGDNELRTALAKEYPQLFADGLMQARNGSTEANAGANQPLSQSGNGNVPPTQESA